MKAWFKLHQHDLVTAVVIFGAAFVSTLMKGGSVSKDVLLSAVAAGAGAVIHSFFGKGV